MLTTELLAPAQRRSYGSIMIGAGPELVSVSLEPSPVIDAYKKDVDRSLLRENLKLSPQQRVEKMLAAANFAEELRRSRPRTPRP